MTLPLWTVLQGCARAGAGLWGGRGVLESFLSNHCPRTV